MNFASHARVLSEISSKARTAFLLRILAPVLVLAFAAVPAYGQPGFSISFNPDSIGPGNVSVLTYEIDNGSGVPVTGLMFTDNLSTGITVADPSFVSTDCVNVDITAVAGTSTIQLLDGEVPAFTTCTISVDVTSSFVGSTPNTTGDLTSSAGNSGDASDDLFVSVSEPSFSKAFSPSTIDFGERTTLTFTIDNSANPGASSALQFTDTLPGGLVIADPANASTDCSGGILTAEAGDDTISLRNGVVFPGLTCTVVVDVAGNAIGSFINRTELIFSPGSGTQSAGWATAALDVTLDADLHISKDFIDDPVAPGDTVTLEFTIRNQSPSNGASNITFTDDLDATLSGLVATGTPLNDVCGTGSVLSGTSQLTLTGGNLSARDACTFSVTLQVPAGATSGDYPNTTSTVSATVGGNPVTGNQASQTLYVSPVPVLTKTFLSNPVGAGDSVTIEFTLTNSSTMSAATDLEFQDNLSAFLSGAVYTSGLQNDVCGAGSVLTTQNINGQVFLSLFNGSLAPSATCTFTADLLLPEGGASGSYVNTTSDVEGNVGGSPVIGPPATDTLDFVVGPALTKEFTDDPVMPGDTVTLEFTLTSDVGSPGTATAIAFTDDLDAALTGLSAVGLPQNDVCGAGSQLSGTTTLSFTGGTLAPGASCTFSVTLQVPAGALPGDYTNTTSNVTADVNGLSTTRLGAQDNLMVGGLTFTKAFIDDPLIPGQTGILRFTIENQTSLDATGLFFTDNLTATLSGLTAVPPLPITPCGAGSSITGTTLLIFSGGSLTGGTSCTFDIFVMVPAAASDGNYINTTSNLSGTLGADPIVLPPAADVLDVTSDRLELTKEFTDDPASPGDTVTLEFTLTNLDPDDAANSIAFTDDLNAALSGLVAVGLPANNICNGSGSISGTTNLSFSGGSLAAGASCTFQVTVQVPGGASSGTYTNTTSSVSGTINGLPVSGAAASDDLVVSEILFSKSFDGSTVATGTAVLSFTIDNQSGAAINGLTFTDDLNAALPGLVATGLPLSNVCGTGSQISGTSVLSLSGGNLAAGASCTIDVTVQVPSGTTEGDYVNTSSQLFQSGIPVAEPAVATLTIDPPPTFTKSFDGSTVATGTAVLTFTIQNNSTRALADLSFTDDLDATLSGLVATGLPQSNVCGSGSQVSGTSVISFTGGNLAGSGSCSFDVTVQVPSGASAGTYTNTTSTLMQSGSDLSPAATDDLVIDPPPTFTKSFDGSTVATGTAVLTFTIENNSTRALSDLSFTDDLDATLSGLVATGLPQNDVCGTGSQVSGTSVISLTGGNLAGSGTCSFDVTVQVPSGASAGTYTNTTSTLMQSGSDLSPAATDDLVIDPPPTFSKTFSGPTTATGTVVLTFTIENNSTRDLSDLNFTDDLDSTIPGMTATGLPQNDVCGTGSQVSGTSIISLTGGNLAGNASCSFDVTLQLPAGVTASTYTNTTSDLLQGGEVLSPPATDALTVEPPPAFSKQFAPDTIVVDSTSTLTFTIDNSANSLAATNLAFTDNLPAGVVVATPSAIASTCGGTATAADGSSSISLTGGSVAAGAVCTLSVNVFSDTTGDHVNVSGDLTSSSGNSGTATDTLEVLPPLMISMQFIPASVVPGQIAQIQYTIENPSSAAVSDIDFTQDLDAIGIPGLTALDLPQNGICGFGSQISGTTLLTFMDGSLAGGESCVFTVDVQIPSDATPGTYTTVTSPPTGNAGGDPVVGEPGMAEFVVQADVLDIPTLDQWALLLLISLLGLIGVARIRF